MNHGDLLFVGLAALTVASPGPGVLMTLDNAVQRGWRASMHGVVGLAVGAALMAGLSATGVGLVLRSSEFAFDALRVASASYLLYLAVRAWMRSLDPRPVAAAPAPHRREERGLFLRGVVLQTSNPKSLLFFVAVLPTVLQGQPSPARQALPVAVYCVLLLLIHAAYAGAAARSRRWLRSEGIARWIARVSALTFLGFALVVLGTPGPAAAATDAAAAPLLYLDPGTGGLLFSLLTGLAGTTYFIGKELWRRLHDGLRDGRRGASRATAPRDEHRIALYSEGRAYASTFAPIVEELIRRGVRGLYLSSDPDDPVLDLAACGSQMDSECIGSGPVAWARLRRVRARVMAMTTPGLDVLQIRRSRHVARYVHLVHAPTDKSFNRTFSFDHFDAVVINGLQQARVIRRLELLRGGRRKRLHLAGCVYYDSLWPAYEQAVRSLAAAGGSARAARVLIAPTWGRNSLLQRHGSTPIRALVEAGFEVVVRPHPQSWQCEPDMLHPLIARTAGWPNCRWDRATSAAEAMAGADLLLSDLSGIAFDFAFLTGRPVLTLAGEIDKRGFEAMDLPFEPWELDMLDRIGRRVDATQLDRLARIAREELARTDRAEDIARLRADAVVNFGRAASAVVDAIERTASETDVPFIEGDAVAAM